MPTPASVTLLSRPGCHLCDTAREVLAGVLVDFELVSFTEKSILDDAELHDRYVEDIPVVLINNKVHNIYRVDPARLRAALEEATK
ncbi:MAG: thioredoxin family protein [Glaciihabitans sp.]|nr:thioredoxin family protein [Glaciihabitans sp.]